MELAPSLSDSSAMQAALFGRFMPAPTYNTLLGYGFVKYKPSDAGLGQPASNDASTESSSAQEAHVQSEYKAYSNTQTRNQSQLNPESVPQVISG